MDDRDDGSPEPNLTLEDDGVIVLAQPTANPPPTPASNTPAVIVDVENQKAYGNPADTPAP